MFRLPRIGYSLYAAKTAASIFTASINFDGKVIDYIRTYKQFISSHHFYEGIRMTVGVMTPVLLFSYLGHLAWGVTTALGAVAVSITDNPGPAHHRRNGMLFTIAILFVTIFITGISVPYPWLVLLLLAIVPFSFSMLGVFGVRAGAVGLAGLLVLTLNIDKTLTLQQVLMNAILSACGGAWYFLLSMALHQLRPYKLVQQVLGDCIQETAKYLRAKAELYKPGVNTEEQLDALAEAQIQVHNKQEAVRELLFKTRSIVKESTHTGRVLVMSFLDVVDLFERIMTTQLQGQLYNNSFRYDQLMVLFYESMVQLAEDLEGLGVGFQEVKTVAPQSETDHVVKKLEQEFNTVRVASLNDENALEFTHLRLLLNNIKDVKNRIDILHQYSSYDLNLSFPERTERDYKRFVTRSQFSPGLIWDNLNRHSNIFRHAVRVSLALLTGYVLSLLLPLGHDYWILLTIIVILKPAYALTRQRNFQRLAGTIGGVALGALILFLIQDKWILITILLVCMLIAYSNLRTRYLTSVFFMTVFILIAFYFLKAGNTTELLKDRVIDTGIGSAISFILIFLLPPKWEHENIRSLCIEAIEANKRYFTYIAGAFAGDEVITSHYKLRRKETYVALANLSDAFQRMLNEPKSKQQHGEYFHQLIVSNHVLASQIATLSAYRIEYADSYQLKIYRELITQTEKQLEIAENWLHPKVLINEQKQLAEPDFKLNLFSQMAEAEANLQVEEKGLKKPVFDTLQHLMSNIYRVSADIKSVCKKL